MVWKNVFNLSFLWSWCLANQFVCEEPNSRVLWQSWWKRLNCSIGFGRRHACCSTNASQRYQRRTPTTSMRTPCSSDFAGFCKHETAGSRPVSVMPIIIHFIDLSKSKGLFEINYLVSWKRPNESFVLRGTLHRSMWCATAAHCPYPNIYFYLLSWRCDVCHGR